MFVYVYSVQSSLGLPIYGASYGAVFWFMDKDMFSCFCPLVSNCLSVCLIQVLFTIDDDDVHMNKYTYFVVMKLAAICFQLFTTVATTGNDDDNNDDH